MPEGLWWKVDGPTVKVMGLGKLQSVGVGLAQTTARVVAVASWAFCEHGARRWMGVRLLAYLSDDGRVVGLFAFWVREEDLCCRRGGLR